MLIFVPRVFLVRGFRLPRNNSVLLEVGILIAFFYKQTNPNKQRIQSDFAQNNWQSQELQVLILILCSGHYEILPFISTHAGDEQDNVYDH